MGSDPEEDSTGWGAGPQAARVPDLELRSRLDLASEEDRSDLLTQVIHFGEGGGGLLVYGLDEWDLQAHPTLAHTVRPLKDPRLRAGLEQTLQESLTEGPTFRVRSVAVTGGFVLVVEVDQTATVS